MALEGLDVCQIETERASFFVVITIPKNIVLGIDLYFRIRKEPLTPSLAGFVLRLLGFHISLDFMYYFNCRRSHVVWYSTQFELSYIYVLICSFIISIFSDLYNAFDHIVEFFVSIPWINESPGIRYRRSIKTGLKSSIFPS